MQLRHRILLTGTAFAATPAAAQTMDVAITLPRMNVAEYHRPYVAIWLEKEGTAPRTIAVWYDFDRAKGEGQKWLHEIRQWWRAAGRTTTLPADGISGATRAPGVQKLSFTNGRGSIGTLAPGNYTLVVEAAREVGGRELVRVPFAWPPAPGAVASASGKTELGAVSLSFKR